MGHVCMKCVQPLKWTCCYSSEVGSWYNYVNNLYIYVNSSLMTSQDTAFCDIIGCNNNILLMNMKYITPCVNAQICVLTNIHVSLLMASNHQRFIQIKCLKE
jgi:hypothetical protein